MSLTTLEPHPWQAMEFAELLALLPSLELPVRIGLTRPSERSYGEGALRVLRVRIEVDAIHLLLAYERYRSRPGAGRRDRER